MFVILPMYLSIGADCVFNSTFVLFMLVISLGLQAWIRAIAAATSALATAQSVGGISVIIMGLYTGEIWRFQHGLDLCTHPSCHRLYSSKALASFCPALDNGY